MTRFATLLLVASILTACASTTPAPSIGARIDSAIARPPLQHAVWGILVEDEGGRQLYARNEHVLLMPASNRKLFSAATDANCIGLSTRLATELWIDGEDVIVKGDGDPSFGSDRHESPAFGPFVTALRGRGVTVVRDIVIDVSSFDRATIPGSWKVGNLPSSYAAPVDAIAYRENAIGGRSVPDPASFAGAAFRDALILGGIGVSGNVRVNTEPRNWQERVTAIESPTLFQLLASVLKNSQNLYAEMLFKRSGGGSYDGAAALERQFLVNEAGIDPAEAHFVDGCGLSPEDLVTPAATIRVLRWMNTAERRGIWWLLLAQPNGEGTLRNRLTDLESRLRGKTGSIANVNALSGIIRGTKGGYRYFAVVINHHLAGGREALDAIDDIVEEVAKF